VHVHVWLSPCARECVPLLMLGGEGYNLVRDVCSDDAHPFDEVDGVLGESGVQGAVSCGWSCHDGVLTHAWLSESCR
jgi:hypothetical protein